MGKVVLVTGSAGYIGRALVERFGAEGFDVIGLDKVRPTDLGRSTFIAADLQSFATEEDYRLRVLSQIASALPSAGLDVLVNNAAVQIVSPTAALSADDWHQTMHVNVTAPFLLVQGLLRQLEIARGCVLNIASIHAQLTKPGFAAYATSKAALAGLTRALAVDLGGAIRVNGIAPAAIDTPMLRSGFANDDLFGRLRRFHPVGDLGTPEQVAAVALMMTAGELRFLSGSIVQLDGAIGSRLHDPA